MIIVDEAAYISLELLMNTILPVMMQSETSLIATTTPRTSDHFFSVMAKMKDAVTGRPLFNVIRIGEPCEDCKKLAEPWTCGHNFEEDAPWKSRAKSKKFAEMYKKFNMEDVHMREQFGSDADNADRAFDVKHVDALRQRDRYVTTKRPRLIYLAADPAGAGPSCFGLVAGYFAEGKLVVRTSPSC